MASQNINNYYFNRYDLKLDYSSYFDLTLASDERDYDEEVVFSTDLIANTDGNRLPINIDLNSANSNLKQTLKWNKYYSGNTVVSQNYYNPNNVDLTCFSAYTGLCDVGLVATDNGLYDKMTGQTLYYKMGVEDNPYYKFHPHYYDRHMKLHPVTSYAQWPNFRFTGSGNNTLYNIVSKEDDNVGYYNELYGGFYQGFYKLHGWDYEVFPERVNKGWTAEFLLKPRQRNEYTPQPSEQYLNDIYPENAGTFFYFGTRAEDKYYHFASGSPVSDTGYTRVTESLSCLKTCACASTAVTNSDCINVYPSSATTVYHNIGCGCGACTSTIPVPPKDPKFDVLSNALSLRLSGDPKNPRLCVKYIKITGDCVTTGTCSTTGVTYETGYTINEICSTRGIYDSCDYNNILCYTANTKERWVMITSVFERYQYLEDCDLLNVGGLGDIREQRYPSSINGAAYNLIMPPQTHSGTTKEKKRDIIEFNQKWLDQVNDRRGLLKLYVNGYLFMIIEDFEEIIPHELNTEREKQIGVPFNISWGGGTQGLHDHLIFSGCTERYGPYIQDPELLPNNILSGSSLSALTTNILLEENFGGTFMGGISQFRMYVEPLASPQVQHNYRILKNKFDLYDFWCPNCYDCLLGCYFDFSIGEVACDYNFIINELTCDFGFNVIDASCDFDFNVK